MYSCESYNMMKSSTNIGIIKKQIALKKEYVNSVIHLEQQHSAENPVDHRECGDHADNPGEPSAWLGEGT